MKQQQRFIFALAASALVLIAWNFLFPPTPPPAPNANQPVAQSSPQPNGQPSAQPSAQATATANATATPSPAQAAASPTPTPENVPARKIQVVTPLYQATFDSRGAVVTSWIIKKNKNTGTEIHAASSTKNNPKPLELIPTVPEGVDANQLMHTLQIVTGDAATDAALAGRNSKISGTKAESGDETVNVDSGSKKIEFLIHDDATGLDAKKTIEFFADRYSADVTLNLTRYGQAQPDPKLVIGPSIGDQGIDQYTFYLYQPEGISVINGNAHRVLATEVHSDRRSTGTINWMLEGLGLKSPVMKPADRDPIDGAMHWGGVGDTYFGMIAVPSRQTYGLEYRTLRYEHKVSGKAEERFLITGLIPIPADGTKTELYVGPKDHALLAQASQQIKQNGGPQVDLGEAINYGFLAGMRRFLAVPILIAINALQRMTGSYGVAIILFTILIYSLFFPLKWQSSRKMKKAQKYAPRMKELQEKLKGMKQNDPRMKELQMEQLRLMKEANPLGGCLPLLIQMPFLFALYTALTISIDFRQASFLWIPDLSGPEPYLLGFIRILPLMFTGSMIFLQLLTPAPSADPLQRKMMAIGMPLFMLYILWSAPSGLLLYWLVGNIVGFSQQLIINRLTKEKEEEPPPDQ
ncbi:MAG TPA: membrane protein insertase YidC, partial [Pyrinomonadaceae bacterium]|nr:membrane protein insertase YidC [Pyrinomonadaceae bacterium]